MNNKKYNSKQALSKKLNVSQNSETFFDYKEEEVFYENKNAGIKLAGTLTLPNFDGPLSAVILISGMGPNDRDYTMLGHKPFLKLADHLTRQGIAVLRFDKRGAGKSTGTFNLELTSEDFASDVIAGVEYLKARKDINFGKIGLIGHSEGGLIASMVAARCKDISCLVTMAGFFLTDSEDMINNISMQLKVDGASEELILQNRNLLKNVFSVISRENDTDIAEKLLKNISEEYFEDLTEALSQESQKFHFSFTKEKSYRMIKMYNSKWYRYFFNYNPIEALTKIKASVFAINGDCDFIVPSKRTLSVIESALKKAENKDFTTLELKKMNHWFQECQTGMFSEYGSIKQTISPKVLKLISNWILKRTL